jgi:hypothetical protein
VQEAVLDTPFSVVSGRSAALHIESDTVRPSERRHEVDLVRIVLSEQSEAYVHAVGGVHS